MMLHPDCSHECMIRAGVKPMPASWAFKGDFGELWLLTEQDMAAILRRNFPEVQLTWRKKIQAIPTAPPHR